MGSLGYPRSIRSRILYSFYFYQSIFGVSFSQLRSNFVWAIFIVITALFLSVFFFWRCFAWNWLIFYDIPQWSCWHESGLRVYVVHACACVWMETDILREFVLIACQSMLKRISVYCAFDTISIVDPSILMVNGQYTRILCEEDAKCLFWMIFALLWIQPPHECINKSHHETHKWPRDLTEHEIPAEFALNIDLLGFQNEWW